MLQFAQVTSGKYWRCIPRIIHGVVRPVLEGFFAPHLQGRFFLIPDRTSSVKGWELVYTRCDAIHRFDVVSSVNFSFFKVPNTMQLTTPNHIMLIKKNPNILYKKKKKKKKKKKENYKQIHNIFSNITHFQSQKTQTRN